MKYKIVILQEECNSLEAASYFTDAKANILERILTNESLGISKELFSQYCDEYIEAFASYELMKREVSERYIAPIKKYTDDIAWNIDFSSAVMTIEADITVDQYREVYGHEQ